MDDSGYKKYIEYVMNDGFLIPQFSIERPLYRYRSNIDYIVNEIENDHVYMCPIEALNDPFDSSYAISYEEALDYAAPLELHLLRCYFLQSKNWFKAVEANLFSLKNKEFTLWGFAELLEDEIKKVGGYYPASAIARNYYEYSFNDIPKRIISGRVACFSEVWNSIPMWSYYADSHKGVCLKYDFNVLDKEKQSFRNILVSVNKVWYSQYRPSDKEGKFSPFVKGLPWAHEQEWRLFREFGSEYVQLPCLTEIYLGVNFDYNNIERIIESVKKVPREIDIYVLKPNPDNYGFCKKPLYID